MFASFTADGIRTPLVANCARILGLSL